MNVSIYIMANIVIIDDDDKIVREISRFIKELSNDHNIRVFKTAELFLKRYSKLAQNANLQESNTTEALKVYTDDQVRAMQNLSFGETPAFGGEKMTLVLSKETSKIEKVTVDNPSSPVFGYATDALVQLDDAFKKLIPKDFFANFEGYLKNLEKAESTIMLCMQNQNGFWLLTCQGRFQSNKFILSLVDQEKKAKSTLTKNLNDRKGNEVKELDMLSSIHLVIFKNGLIEGEANKWVNETKEHLNLNGFFPENNYTRFVVTKYDDDGTPNHKLSNPLIEDLVLLPLDRLLFLQKLQIILALPERVKPQYLFLQPVDAEVKLSKKIKLESINDIGLSIKNPVALKAGVPTVFYFKFPTSDKPISTQAKCSYNIAHPTEVKSLLTFFDYFGLERAEMMQIKQYLRNTNEYKELRSTDDNDFVYSPENIFLNDEDKRLKHIIVLDVDEQRRKQTRNSLTEHFQNIRCIEESSYYLFEKKYLTGKDETVPLKEHELYDKKIIWKIDSTTYDLVNVLNQPKETDLICGHKAELFFEGPKEWKLLFPSEASQELILSNLNNTPSSKEANFLIDLEHQDTSKRIAKLALRLEGDQIEMCLMVPGPKDLEADVIESVDAIVIEARMVPSLFDDWFIDLNKRIDNRKLNPRGGAVPLIVVGDPKEMGDIDIQRFWNLTHVPVFLKRPFDSRTLCYHVSRLAGAPFSRYQPDNIGYANVGWSAYAAKPVRVVELSEFGCTLRLKKPLKPGTTVYLHDFIYKNAPDQHLCARIYYCKEEAHEDGDFLAYLVYYGIDDSFLKYTRNWIRENYAQQKSKA